jgi:oxygen-independent coproporphyrinogen-3 oxidase
MINNTIHTRTKVSLYIHFPLCLKKCLYCSFNSVAGSHFPMEEYAAALMREMRLCSANLDAPVVAHTFYLGGGTPSLMEPALVGRIVDAAAGLFNLASDAEITIEANPGTVTAETLSGYRACGINRLSLGVQSFHDALLERLGRIHSAGQTVEAFTAARAAGFTNIGVDLINSLPGQTIKMWEDDLFAAIALQPEHVSVYGLTIDEGTPFASLEKNGELLLPDEEEAAVMFERSAQILGGSGYEQYEIANFAQPNYRSRHNQVYWQRGDYLGFGAGAHSFAKDACSGVRWKNPDDPDEYRRFVNGSALPWQERHCLTSREAMAEHLFLGLRMLEGVDLELFRNEFGVACEDIYSRECSTLSAEGLLEIREGRLRLTEKARIVANRVFVMFL